VQRYALFRADRADAGHDEGGVMSSRFSRKLPPRPNLDQQKTLARELFQAFASGDSEARDRVRDKLPDKKRIVLADAQFVLAREYGFESWAELRAHVAAHTGADEPPEKRLRDALVRGDARSARRVLESTPELRAHINDPVFPFDSPAITCFANDAAIVDVLLDFGADPNRRSDWWAGGFHALHSATGAAAERLLTAGAIPDACAAAHLDRPDLLARMLTDDPQRVHERGGDGQTPLHFARSRKVVDMLLDAGADIDARDVDHRATAAQWMLDRKRGEGRYDLARYLVERGASVDIFLAAALGLSDRVRAMLEADPAQLELRTGQGDYGEMPPSSYHIYFWTIGTTLSPIQVAAQFQQPETLDVTLRFATPVQRLVFTARSGDADSARALLRMYPRIVDSMMPSDHAAIADAAWGGDARAVALMLELGFDPRTVGHDGGTALHCASWEGSAESVAALLRHPDARNLVTIQDAHYGATPLGWCCHGSVHGNPQHEHAHVARLLLDAGAIPGKDASHASEEVEAVLTEWRSRNRGAD
jgi:ankyrin repeat protein